MALKRFVKKIVSVMLLGNLIVSNASAYGEITISQSGAIILESETMSGTITGDTATSYNIEHSYSTGSGSNNSARVLTPSEQAYWNAYYNIYQKRNALVNLFSDIYDDMTADNGDGVGDFNGRTYTIYNWLESLDNDTREQIFKLYRDYIGSLGETYIDENSYLSDILNNINSYFGDDFTVSGEALDNSGNIQNGQRYLAAQSIDGRNPYASSVTDRISITGAAGIPHTNRQLFNYLLRIYYDMIERGVIPGSGSSQVVLTPHDASYNFDSSQYNLFSMIQQLLNYIQTYGGEDGSYPVMTFLYNILGIDPDADHTGRHSKILDIYDNFIPTDIFGVGDPDITGIRADIYPTDENGNGLSDYASYSRRYGDLVSCLLEDKVFMMTITDYAINGISITNTEISSIDNDTRRWTVSNRDTNAEVGTYETVGRVFTFANFDPGRYKVECFAEATRRDTISALYQKYDYLVDEAGNILYWNQFSNNQAFTLYYEYERCYISTQEVFFIKVLEDGTVTLDGDNAGDYTTGRIK